MSHAERLARLREVLDRHNLEGLLVSQPESRFYLSGYTGHDLPPRDSAGYLLVTRDGSNSNSKTLLLTDPRTTEQAEHEAPLYEVVTYAAGSRGPESVGRTAHDLGLSRLGFEAVHLPYGVWQEISRHVDGLVPTEGLVDELRVVKDADELAALQQAVDVLDRCLAHILAGLEPGVTERQIARRIEVFLIEHADGPSFPSIVASGPNSSIPHAVPSQRSVQAGEALKIDIGARVGGYCSDMTRTVCLGQPADGRLAELHALVLEAQEHVERSLRPGMTGREADGLARQLLERGGYADGFSHGLGHGIGLEVHEPPWLSPSRGDAPLRPGMVFSVEPGVYLPGWGGVRIEDLVVLEPDGARVLCSSPKSLTLESVLRRN